MSPIWQHGEKGKKGYTAGLPSYPDGVYLDVLRDWKAALRKQPPALPGNGKTAAPYPDGDL